MTAPAAQPEVRVAEEDKLRADLYGLLAGLLARPPERATLETVSGLDGDDSDMGRAIGALAAAAKRTDSLTLDREFHDLFIGMGRGELLPYASYYLTGFLHEKPLARLRADMLRLGIARARGVSEPEDHIAQLLEIMRGLILGEFGAPATVKAQRELFNTHLAPWATHFFTDLEGAEHAVFYAPVGTIGRLFVDIEQTAFRMEG